MPRGELAEALWGETPPQTWEKALSVLASKLRALLAANGVDGAPALTSAFSCYRLELPEGSWVDVLAAAAATTDAETALAAGDLEQAKTAGGAGESLVRQPFLPGDDGPWVEEKRREIAEGRVRALSVLAEACLRSGDAGEAATWAAEIVALEPFRESGYRQLMQAHVAAGNRGEALRVYERCRRLLADELGAYPSPETEAVYRRLLEQRRSGRLRRTDVRRGAGARWSGSPGDAAPETTLGRRRSGRRRRRSGRHLRRHGRWVARDSPRELDRRP